MNVTMLTGLCINLIFGKLPPEGKFDPESEEAGGFGATAAFILPKLGHQVTLCGPYTKQDQAFRRLAEDAGITWRMQPTDGPQAVNAVLTGPRILRICKAPGYAFTKDEGEHAARARIDALVVGGSLANDYLAPWLHAAAARGIPVFLNPGAKIDLDILDCGAEVYLQVSAPEFAEKLETDDAEAMVRLLLARTPAAGVVVTGGEKGAVAMLRDGKKLTRSPAIPIGEPVKAIGAGDAHWAGFASVFVQAPRAIRLDRALHVARLIAARHCLGLPPCGWHELSLFERGLDRIPEIHEAA